MKTAQFYDARSSLVDDALESLVRTNSLLLIKEHRVVVSPHSVHGRVAVISGGGSGHEPSHAGFVGSLLDAAVCGDVFASPSVAQIGAALSHLHSKGAVGVLCVVKNYTGDRLNFGIAAERSSIPTLLVFVDDDVTPSAKPRGLAATLFVHKVASVLAREGKSLAEIADACNRVISNSFTIGATLRECDIPGLDKKESSRIAPGFIEIGMGIHGEDGWEKVEYANCSSLTSDLANRLSQEANDGKEFAVIVNNLGSCSGLEIGCVIKGFLKTDLGRKCTLLASGSLMTALNMHGFSISILNLDQEVRRALMVPAANCPLQFSPISDDWLIAVPEQSAANFEKTFESMDWIETACEVLLKNESLLNDLDRVVGDGDCGSTLGKGARNAKQAKSFLHLASICEQMGGSSGAVLSILFSAASRQKSIIDGLIFGTERVIHYGGAPVKDSRTFLDALIPALHALKDGKSFVEAAVAAREGAERTKRILTTSVGRSSYLNGAALSGHADPGAVAVALVFEAFAARK